MKSRVALAVVVAAGLFVAGCSVPKKLVWLPDSSGFLYVRSNGTVMRFDVRDAKQRVLVRTKTMAPQEVALSPDGKRFAVVNVTSEKSGNTVSVTVYDMTGKEVSTSKSLLVNRGTAHHSPKSGAVWSADKVHLLITYTKPGDPLVGDELRSLVCNTRTGELTEAPVKACFELDIVFALPLIRPDGKGFLGQRKSRANDKWNLVFVEWTEKVHALTEEDSLRDFKRRTEPNSRPGDGEFSSFKREGLIPTPVGRWEKHVAVIPIETGELLIDTEKRRMSFRPVERIAKRHRELAARNVLRDESLVGSRYRVRLRIFEKKWRPSTAWMRFELFDAKLNAATVNLSGFVDGYPARMIYPSPDRKHVAILYAAGNIGRATPPDYEVRVIRSDGKIVATFDVK